MEDRPDFHKCLRPGCRIWIEWNKRYCNDCHRLYFDTNEDLGFYSPEYAKGDGDLKVYEGE